MMLFHALLLYCGAEMVEQTFITSHNAPWNITALRCMSFKKLQKHIMYPFVFAHWKAHIINKFSIILKLILSAWDCVLLQFL